MMRKLLIIIVLIFCLFGAKEVTAQTRLRSEWGFVAGASYPIAKFDMGESSATIKPRLGWSGGLHMALKFGNTFAIQPEIIYTYAKVSISDIEQKFATEMKTNTLQIPILFSLRFGSVFRINAGPVLTVMDNPTYLDKSGEKVMFGRLHPTVSYAVGVSAVLLRKLVVDARVSSGVKSMENFLSYDAKQQGNTIKTTTINAQLKVGVLF